MDDDSIQKEFMLEATPMNLRNRIVFAPSVPHRFHTVRLQLADLVFDPLGVGAHTSALDAIWASCGFISLGGTRFINRVGSSLLHAMQASGLIVNSLEEYKTKAIFLGKHPKWLGTVE